MIPGPWVVVLSRIDQPARFLAHMHMMHHRLFKEELIFQNYSAIAANGDCTHMFQDLTQGARL